MGKAAAPSAAPASDSRPIYQSIFCSYSHKDTQIVERVERVYKALGMTFLRDVVTLRSGQDWDAELLRLIEQADIFQLFWSSAASQSQAVRKEWLHALSLKRQDRAFIRPVFWEQPMPPPAPELAAIHFAYEPELDHA
ncbi:MAG: toll/interleukin-1 receptor domain-containing protein [Anaerolineae bacterium]